MIRSASFIFFSFLGLISTSSYAEDKKDETPRLVISPGIQYAEGTFAKNIKWQGLYCNKLDCSIKNTKVKIDRVVVDYIDDEKVPLDQLQPEGKPVALFPKGKFKVGEVSTWHVFDGDIYDFWNSKQFSKIKKSKKWRMPWGTVPLTLSRKKITEKNENGSMQYISYSISDGKTKQFLFKTYLESHYGSDTTPIIHWVGDLDGDGKLDLILDLPDDNCGYDERLYLSSKAEKGKFLKEVIKNEGNQPACGC